VGLGSGEDRGERLRGTAVRAGLPDVFVRAHLERSLRDSVFPTIASVPRLEAARATEASSRSNRPGVQSAGVTGGNSPHYTNQPRKTKTDRVPVKYLFFSTLLAALRRNRNQFHSRPEQVQLLRNPRARLLRDTTQSFEQTVDAVADGERRAAARARELRACQTLEFESNKKLPFFLGEPSPVLAFIEKVRKENRRAGRVAAGCCLVGRGAGAIRLVRELDAGFADGPAERAAAHLSCNRESQMRPARAQFLGIEELQKHREKVLGRVLARQRRKCRADLAGGAVNGGNKNQEQNLLAHGIERSLPAGSYKLSQDFIGRRTSFFAVLAVKVRDQFRGGRKCGQDPARRRAQPVFFQAFFMMQFIDETRLQTADQATAVASGHHDAAPAPRAVCNENGPVPYARTWFGDYGGRGTAPVVFGAELAGSQGAVPEARAARNRGRTCRKKYCYASRRSGESLRDRSEVRPAQKKAPALAGAGVAMPQ